LEKEAGTPDNEQTQPAAGEPEEEAPAPPAAGGKKVAKSKVVEEATKVKSTFPEGLVRWARLSPSLKDQDIASYLVFAASFKSIFLAAQGLPERVRDLATNLLSPSIGDNRSVTKEMLEGLTAADMKVLASHIGGVIMDQPARQTPGVTALIRMARYRVDAIAPVIAALRRIPPKDLKAGGLIQLEPTDPAGVFEQFASMAEVSGNAEIKGALAVARDEA
jgi:hypothetical protein